LGAQPIRNVGLRYGCLSRTAATAHSVTSTKVLRGSKLYRFHRRTIASRPKP
jgi:hypothetical protein